MSGAATASARDTLARTIWGEARGQGVQAMEAVASVIMNRAKHPRWWGTTVEGVCRAKWQFSCWNDDDPNLPKLLAVTKTDPQFAEALVIASNAILGGLDDPTHNSDSYYDTSIPAPIWSLHKTCNHEIGPLRFFAVELTPTKEAAKLDPLTIIAIAEAVMQGIQEAIALWPTVKALVEGGQPPTTEQQAQIDAALDTARAKLQAA